MSYGGRAFMILNYLQDTSDIFAHNNRLDSKSPILYTVEFSYNVIGEIREKCRLRNTE
jgi:hypothetical protein